MNLENHYEILELLFNTMPFVFWKDKDGKYQGVNLNQAKVFGYSSAVEMIGKTIFEILEDQDSAKLVDETDNRIMMGEGVVIIEETLKTPSGSRVYLSQKQPIKDYNGDAIGLLGFSMDITEIKEHERMAYELSQEIQNRVIKCLEDVQHAVQSCKIGVLHQKTGIKSSTQSLEDSIQLTKREREILYYLSLNKSPKDIAAILSIVESKNVSPTTVQAIIDKQLYPKLDVYNIGQLVEKANLLNLIPFILD
jgi:PAS domain S-box-containing protein